MKVVINKCYGGFGLSKEALERYIKEKMSFAEVEYVMSHEKESSLFNYFKVNGEYFSEYDIERTDPVLVKIVEEMGADANCWCSKLKVVDIPDDVEWEIEECDGTEWIAEKHRTWS